jgi:hypothetical protein
VLCDEEWRVITEKRWELRPKLVEGRNQTTGAVIWRLDLQGEIDEAGSEKVLRIDEDRHLVNLSSGPILLDLRSGPQPAPEGVTAGWCKPESEGDDILRRGVVGGRPFARAKNAFPCQLGGEIASVDLPTLPIPEFAGVNVSGWGAWVEDSQVHAKHQ